MARNKPYGRAYRISKADASAYERTSRPRYKPNPMGVTSMAAVNGRGSYASARSAATGKSRAERIARARAVIRNGTGTGRAKVSKNGESSMAKRAGFLKNRKRMRRNEAEPYWEEALAIEEAKKASAKKTRARNKPKAGKKAKPAAKKKPLSVKAKKAKAVRGGKRLAAFQKAKRAGKTEVQAARSAIRAVPLKVGESFKGKTKRKATKRKVSAASRIVGGSKPAKKTKSYKRLTLLDPKTGKRRLSFMAKGKKGKRVRIPAKTLVKTGYLKQSTIDAARKRAAARILKSGDAFTPNKKKGKKKVATAKQKRAGKRLAAYRAALKKVRSKAKARAAAVRAVPLRDGDTFLGSTSSAAPKRKKRKSKAKKGTKRKTSARRTKKTTKRKTATRKTAKRKTAKKTVRRTSAAKRSASAKKAARTRKRNAAAKASGRKTTKRKSTKRKTTKRTGAKRKTAKRRSYKRNGRRRSYRRNGFLAQLKSVAITGLFVAGGFLAHKVLTNLIVTNVFDKFFTAAPPALVPWKKPIVGAVVLLAGVPAVGLVFKKNSTEILGGMAASLIQSLIVAAITPSKPAWAASLQGYSNSRAYSLRGPNERNAMSIAPQYAPIGSYQQAAAGYLQAAAGVRGAGEYFQANGTGEYFAPNNLQGVGSYEAAGSLAMQAAAGVDEIDDGIRPDSDIDGLLDLAEAAAGLRGTGEFYTAVKASGGRVVSKRVGETSQWIPAGPLWAGADFVDDTQDTSELSAGILQRQGGNGVLSAG